MTKKIMVKIEDLNEMVANLVDRRCTILNYRSVGDDRVVITYVGNDKDEKELLKHLYD